MNLIGIIFIFLFVQQQKHRHTERDKPIELRDQLKEQLHIVHLDLIKIFNYFINFESIIKNTFTIAISIQIKYLYSMK